MRTETVKIVNPNDTKGGFMVVNKSDFDVNQAGPEDKKWQLHNDNDAEEGTEGQEQTSVSGNKDGTFDTPTPTDIRYSDKDATEFANNHGAFVGTSAADLRDNAGMEQKPGGIVPEVHEAVQESEEATRAAQDLQTNQRHERDKNARARHAQNAGKGGKGNKR